MTMSANGGGGPGEPDPYQELRDLDDRRMERERSRMREDMEYRRQRNQAHQDGVEGFRDYLDFQHQRTVEERKREDAQFIAEAERLNREMDRKNTEEREMGGRERRRGRGR